MNEIKAEDVQNPTETAMTTQKEEVPETNQQSEEVKDVGAEQDVAPAADKKSSGGESRTSKKVESGAIE